MDNEHVKKLIQDGLYKEAELYLYQNQEKKDSMFWCFLGEALRGQSRLNEAHHCLKQAINCPDPTVSSFYHLGRLEGENVSFHRKSDIRKSKYKYDLARDDDIVYSCFGEQEIIKQIAQELSPHIHKYAVDVGAGDGMTFSNTYPLYREGWNGICFEPSVPQFHDLTHSLKDSPNKIGLCNEFVTPDNVLTFFEGFNIPKDFGFLSLDIDSYDYYVLEKILEKYTPAFICTEINENIFPPVCYALKYQNMNRIPLKLLGQSISMVEKLLQSKNYSLICLEYNNLFAVRNDLICHLKSFQPKKSTELYYEGFINKNDNSIKLHWSFDDTWNLLQMTPEQRFKTYVECTKMYLGDYHIDEI